MLDDIAIQEFPLRDGLIYLNHAAVAPWPRRTADAVIRFAEENMHSGAADYGRWQAVEHQTREQCARLVGAPSPDDIGFTKNTSEALSMVAYGFPWQPGDNVVISAEEFPSNRIVWESLATKQVSVRKVPLQNARDPEQALVDAADRRTRLLSVSSVQYASGLRMNLLRLGDICRRRGIAFCVDAIQGVGAIPHDVEAMRIDFLMADAHKWLLGPEGIALFYCRPEWRERLALNEYGWHMLEAPGDYDSDTWTVTPTARRFECGSPNMLGLHAFSASLSLLLETGADAIEKRILERSELLFRQIQRYPSLVPITVSIPGRYAGIVTLKHGTKPAEVLHKALRSHNVICAPRGGGIRFSPHFYTPLEQLEMAIEVAAA
jgi:cysteine desulfurase / selenocysteine lyase